MFQRSPFQLPFQLLQGLRPQSFVGIRCSLVAMDMPNGLLIKFALWLVLLASRRAIRCTQKTFPRQSLYRQLLFLIPYCKITRLMFHLSCSNELWAASAGAEFRMPDCGSIDLPRNRSTAAFFTLSRDRFIQTQALNLAFAQYVIHQFLFDLNLFDFLEPAACLSASKLVERVVARLQTSAMTLL